MQKELQRRSNQQDCLLSLSERLVIALQALKISQIELAKRINVKPQSINYLCNSYSKKSRFTYVIAEALEINSLWLATGQGDMINAPSLKDVISSQYKVPLLTREQVIGCFLEDHSLSEMVIEWVFSSSDIGQNGFAFKLTDQSLFPRFDRDTLVFINTQKVPQNSNFVLVYLKSLGDLVFRHYIKMANKVILKPYNTTMFKEIPLSDDDLLLGVMVEARWIL